MFSLHLLLSVFLVSLSTPMSLTSLCILPNPVARHSPHSRAVPCAPSLDSGGEDWCHALGLLPGSVTSGGKDEYVSSVQMESVVELVQGPGFHLHYRRNRISFG